MSNRQRLRDPNGRRRARVTTDVATYLPTIRLTESATATAPAPVSTPVVLTEATDTVTATGSGPARRYRARLIKANVQGSNGYYPAKTLREAAGVFPAGLPVYADHPRVSDEFERPERSIRDLAGRLATDAVFEPDGLYADVEIYPQFAGMVEAMADSIGMSIRAYGTAEPGKPKGQRGPLITAITAADSVDLVTRAGAGGKLVSLLESARAAGIPDLREATANETNTALCDAVRDAYRTENGYAYVRDYDPDKGLVWYDAYSDGESTTWQQGYSIAGDPPVVTLADDRTAVVAQTVYTPAPPEDTNMSESAPTVAPQIVPDGTPPTEPAPLTEGIPSMDAPDTSPGSGQAGTSAGTPAAGSTAVPADIAAAARVGVTEAALADANARNSTLLEATRARAAADARAEAAERELRVLRADGVARSTVDRMVAASPIAESMRPLVAPRVAAVVVGRVPLNEAGEVDVTALEAAITTAIDNERNHAAALLEAQGVGTPRGLGGPVDGPTPQQRVESRIAKFRSMGLSEAAAKVAAVGNTGGVI